MFNMLKHASTRPALLAAALFAIATSAFAQAPTEAQKSAIRSACRSDFMAHCASVTPGGVEAYQCLQSHMSSLSAGCQSAVRAVEPAATPKSEAAPAKSEPVKSEPAKSEPANTEPAKTEPIKTEAAPAAAPAAKPAASAAPKAAAAKPSSAQAAAIKSACRADYPKVCASVPPGGASALECLEKNKAKVSPACEKAVTAAAGGGGATATAVPAAAAPAAGAAPAAAPAMIVLRPLRPREELFIVRSACSADIRSLCAGVAPGGGRIVQCIASNAASLSPACKDVLAPFAAR
ncbi:Cysteine rich repeat-containing protein [Bradyrhizobium sp. Ghvi]|uniref:cysteine rich repeat-containing protein n=1 Tax=Bradyrhizobium sp. Ghvi TaxID=1855319 RepID=UPI0008EE7072|nr:cysteine rich repeat-containing protein [Bradyrhizobium sp. Ghvi]SFO54683.1 Cysteine rich repeat-containing protein [Bradyrhizobium sp. Ghvi]